MLKKKKILLFLTLFMCLFTLIGGVKAEYGYYSSGSGESGQVSGACTTGACGETEDIGPFDGVAIYGVRFTLVDVNNKIVDDTSPVNFWALPDMRDWINDYNKNGGLYQYENDVFTNLESSTDFNKYRLWYYTSVSGDYTYHGIRSIDNSKDSFYSFFQYITKDEPSASEFQYILKSLSKGKISISDASANNYYLKAEPIFVIHYTCYGTNYVYHGNVYEILKRSYNEKGSKEACPYNVNVGGGVYFIKNFITTTYMGNKVEKFPYWDKENSPSYYNRSTLYNEILGQTNAGKALSVNYISINEVMEKLSATIVITKYSGNPDDYDSSWDDGPVKAYYRLLKCDDNGSNCKMMNFGTEVNKINELSNPYPNENIPSNYKKYWNSYNWDKQAKLQQVKISDLSPGIYKIQEIKLNSDIDNVYFRQRTDKAGDYSIDLGEIKPKYDGNYYTATSNTFTISNNDLGKKIYFNVYNDKKSTSSNNGRIIVYKYEYKSGVDGYDFTNFKHYNSIVRFDLYKLVNGKYDRIASRQKKKTSNRVIFNGLENGTYYIEEKLIPKSVIKVYFKRKNYKESDFNLEKEVDLSNSSEVKSDIIEITDDNKMIKYNVYNETSGVLNCDSSLNSILTDNGCDTNSKICSKSSRAKVINELFDLYNEYQDEGDYNKLLNYKITDDGLDLSKVACQSISCSRSTATKMACNQENYIESSKPIGDSDTHSRVCYINSDNDYYSHNSLGSFYNEDIDAYCSVNYYMNFQFPYETVKSGMILWQQFPNYNINRPLRIEVSCENTYKGIQKSDVESRKLDTSKFLNDIVPIFNVSWKTNKEKMLEFLDTIANENNQQYTSPSVECSGTGANQYCYATWNQTYNFNLKYHTTWYSNDSSRRFTSGEAITDFTGYRNIGSGLPISIHDSDQKDSKANVSVTTLDNTYNFDCLYNIKNELLSQYTLGGSSNPNNSKFNFDFRIIDVNHPFSGIDGSDSRLVGDNWCADSRIGKIGYSSSGSYMIGDVNNDGIISEDEYQTDFSKFDIRTAPFADIDGDGEITYSNNCNDSLADNCILFRYTKESNRNNNCTSNLDNNIIKKNITDAASSYSTDAPMYSFTLTPQDIKNIRGYNKEHAYSDYNLKCDDNGSKCLSNVLTDWIKNKKIDLDTDSRCYNARYGGNVWCSNH